MNDKTILIVDDEIDLLEMIKSIFTQSGYTRILTATTGREALTLWLEEHPEMIILDVMMPGMDGFSVLKEIRKTSKVPVLMLTARGEANDRFTGFEYGADDYLIKPFLTKELLLRVQAILNRSYPKKNHIIYLNDSTVNLDTAKTICGRKEFILTAKELLLFKKLAENAGRIVTTGALCRTVCGELWEGYESTLGTHIRHLREKIEVNPSKPVSLATIKGLGYQLYTKEREQCIK